MKIIGKIKNILIDLWKNEDGFIGTTAAITIGAAVAGSFAKEGAKKLFGTGGSGAGGGFSVPLVDFGGLMEPVRDSGRSSDVAVTASQITSSPSAELLEEQIPQENTATLLQKAWDGLLSSALPEVDPRFDITIPDISEDEDLDIPILNPTGR